MPKFKQASATLISLCSPTLDQAILYLIRTSDGKVWAEVTKGEAMDMVLWAKGLSEEYPEVEKRSANVQAMINDGELAEALLGPLNVAVDLTNEVPDQIDGNCHG
jgi:hypothetical protein